MKDTVIEMVSYQLKANVNKEKLAATHENVNAFLHEQQGFMYRSLSEDDKGLLFDVVYWQDMAAAKTAGDAFMAHAAGQSLMALIDEQSVTMRHMPVLTQTSTECQ
jgi:hypothetical protein